VCLAKTASTPQQRVTLLDISHIWLKLADRVGSEPAGGPKIGLGATTHIWRNPPRLAAASLALAAVFRVPSHCSQKATASA
jgi:hypothetical protein